MLFCYYKLNNKQLFAYMKINAVICHTNNTNRKTQITTMDTLRILKTNTTLVDQVEDRLLNYFKEKNFQIGDPVPNEMALAASLGVARNVLREALSRLKMIGMIESRPRRGMILCEPSLLGGMKRIVDPRILSESSLFDILDFRIALEIGICGDIFRNLTDEDLEDLERIEKSGEMIGHNGYSSVSEYTFHSKLYEITGNRTISEFQSLIRPVMEFVKCKFQNSLEPINIEIKERGELVTHRDLLVLLQKRDEEGFKKALEKHFLVYKILLGKMNR